METGGTGGIRWVWPAGAILWLAALATLSPFDLEISRALALPGHWFGRIVQDHGTRPALVAYVALIAWLAVPAWRRSSPLVSRCASAVLVQALVHTMAVTNLLKLLWGRTRFAGLGPDGAGFAPLWSPDPFAGGLSFPSGHVATAFVAAPAVLLLIHAGRGRTAAALAAVTCLFGLVIAAGRITYGAHFATDAAFSIGLAWLFAPVSVALGDRYLALFDRRTRAEGGA